MCVYRQNRSCVKRYIVYIHTLYFLCISCIVHVFPVCTIWFWLGRVDIHGGAGVRGKYSWLVLVVQTVVCDETLGGLYIYTERCCVGPHTFIHIHTHPHTSTHTSTHIHTHIHTHPHTHPHTSTHTSTHIHTHTTTSPLTPPPSQLSPDTVCAMERCQAAAEQLLELGVRNAEHFREKPNDMIKLAVSMLPTDEVRVWGGMCLCCPLMR